MLLCRLNFLLAIFYLVIDDKLVNFLREGIVKEVADNSLTRDALKREKPDMGLKLPLSNFKLVQGSIH